MLSSTATSPAAEPCVGHTGAHPPRGSGRLPFARVMQGAPTMLRKGCACLSEFEMAASSGPTPSPSGTVILAAAEETPRSLVFLRTPQPTKGNRSRRWVGELLRGKGRGSTPWPGARKAQGWRRRPLGRPSRGSRARGAVAGGGCP